MCSDEDGASELDGDIGDAQTPAVRHCPWCGDMIGSFWARRTTVDAAWCESCQQFFRVTLVE